MLPFAVLCVFLAVQCNNPQVRSASGDDTEEETPDPKQGRVIPRMGAHSVFEVPQCPEISGLEFSKDKDFMWAVGDGGHVAKIDFSGKCTQHWFRDADMEGVTIDPESGDLYLSVEGVQKVCRIAAPDYNSLSDMFYVQEAVDGHFKNSGLEGIAYYKDGQLFVGAQKKAMLWLYKTDGTLVWGKSLQDVESSLEEVADLCYDPQTDWLWLIDSDVKAIYIFNSDATECLAKYSVSYIDNAESLLVDREHSCVWVGSDEDNPKLYKIVFADL